MCSKTYYRPAHSWKSREKLTAVSILLAALFGGCYNVSRFSSKHPQRLILLRRGFGGQVGGQVSQAKEYTQQELETIRSWIRREVGLNPSWKVVAFGNQWLCPLCGKAGVKFEQREGLEQLIFQHFTQKCQAYAKGVRADAFSQAKLVRQVILMTVKQNFVSQPLWQAVDREGKWYCPYCASETSVELPADGMLTGAILDEVVSHLDGCSQYDRGKGELSPMDEIRKQIARKEEEARLTDLVKTKVTDNSAWGMKSRKGYWLCPYCRAIIDRLDISTPVLLYESGPPRMARHLLDRCAGYLKKQPPLEDPAESKQLLVTLDPEPEQKRGAAPGSAAPADDLLKSITREIADMKAHVLGDQEMQKSLQAARQKQLQMLPKIPEVNGFTFDCVYRPCSQVSGDFYDFICVSPQHWGILLGDVSGHGIEAGLVMSMARKVINIRAKGNASPKTALAQANTEIYPDLDRRTFATVAYAVLDTAEKRLRFCRAGHNPLLIYNRTRKPEIAKFEPKGLAIGMDAGPRFEASLEEVVVQLQMGDLVFFYTDGISEATNEAGEEVGQGMLEEWVQRYGDKEPRYFLFEVEEALRQFRGNKELEDDITLIAIRVK